MNVKQNLTMLMDFYELTMSNLYFVDGKENQIAVFDMFYRTNPDNSSYSIYAGLEDVINYIQELKFTKDDILYLKSLNIFKDEFLNYLENFKFKGDIYSFKEGSIIYPNEPILTVVAPLIDAQLIETCLLLIVNHESLIATKTNRIVLASQNRVVSDFGARRAHNYAAAIYGAKASYIGGASSTATTIAGKMFNIPVSGTMAHSFVMSYESEYEAFLKYAQTYPKSTVLLIDTYDVINSGLVNAIKVAKEYLIPNGYRLAGVRIDSGDLAYLSKKCRKILDQNGLTDTKIIVSNSLDEYKIQSLISQQAKIDMFGVGENLITSKSSPVFGGVYKLAAISNDGINFTPKIKISETLEKITNPGLKDVYRVYSNEDNKAVADLIAIKGEELDFSKPFKFVDPNKEWKDLYFENCHIENLRVKIFENGKLIYKCPSINQVREFVRYQINNTLWDEEKRFVMPHIHYLDFTPSYFELKQDLIKLHRYEK